MKTVMDLHHTPRQVCVAGKGNMIYVQFSCPQYKGGRDTQGTHQL